MGVGLADMAFFTGWLYLPWVIKPFWSPFIDLFKTKRWWILTMQFLIGVSLASVALFLPGQSFFTLTLICFWLTAFFSATHDVSADGLYLLSLSSHQQAAFVGVRSTFYRVASIAGQGGLVLLAGFLENKLGDIPQAWSRVFTLLSIFFFLMALFHIFTLPKSEKDAPISGVNRNTVIKDFFKTFVSFFRKPDFGVALIFMLLYRFPEALCIKLIQPFLISSRDSGGLGLSTAEAGLVNGTIGVVGLLVGGILGGLCISRGGLKKLLYPMAASLTLPCIFYCLLAMWQPTDFYIIGGAIFIEQLGYGFGFSAYMLYLLYFSRGESATSHYAFCTAFMAIGMMVPGMYSGKLIEWLNRFELFAANATGGYVGFFWIVVASSILTFFSCSLLKIDPQFGKKEKGELEIKEDSCKTEESEGSFPNFCNAEAAELKDMSSEL